MRPALAVSKCWRPSTTFACRWLPVLRVPALYSVLETAASPWRSKAGLRRLVASPVAWSSLPVSNPAQPASIPLALAFLCRR
jgi:hypothetical protein